MYIFPKKKKKKLKNKTNVQENKYIKGLKSISILWFIPFGFICFWDFSKVLYIVIYSAYQRK